jgi:putative endonuclease
MQRDDPRQSFGKLGEDLACAELRRRGYEILARRYRTRYGEIDIIGREDDTIAFIEVKTRAGSEFGGGEAAVNGWKQRRIAQMATDYLARHHLVDRACRFDVVVIDFEHGRPRVEVYQDAFTV